MKEEKESSGFPLDDMLEDDIEPADEWEKREKERRKKAAKLMAKAILAGSLESEDAIAESIMKFYDTANILRSI